MITLIDEKYLTDNTSIDKNKDAKAIKSSLKAVTEYQIKNGIIGIPLYEVFEHHIQDGTELTEKQAVVFDHLKYFIALRVEHEMMFSLVSIGNKGATQEETAASLDIVKAKRQDIDSKSARVKKVIIDYLAANKADFPEHFPEEAQSITPASSTYSAGIVFDDRPYKRFY